ncbi:proline-rich domain-containing protein [Plantibacter sp. CFBP 13570]|uniref:proline-rich domain-containing protein n=1 Tax=Plantibacter sp. CFBP 13570 TaxID=2775272 RepID=UPI001930E07C|nr:proline-rich domain-containing protein [Plantibacter sp. CFBP 13570]MBD8535735.1 hypothetical protein [Plantibacter sp. CFBP 13570]
MSNDDTTPQQPGRPNPGEQQNQPSQGDQQPSYQQGQQQPNPYQSGQQQTPNPYQSGQQQTPNPYQQGQQGQQNPYQSGQQQTPNQAPPAPYGQQTGQQTGAQNPYQQGQQGQQPNGQYATAQNPYATGAPKQPMDPKQKKRIILWSSIAGGALVLIAAAAITISVLNTTAFGPQAKVEEYLKAIAAGDAKLATSLVAPDPSIVGSTDDESAAPEESAEPEATPDPSASADPDADAEAEAPAAVKPTALLTNEVLKGADERIKNPEVGRVYNRNGEARVQVTYELGGKKYEDSVTLESEGKQFPFFDQWKLASSLVGSINVYTGLGGTAFSVNGVNFDGASDESLFAYPAIYTVAPPESKFLQGDAQTITLSSYSAGEGSAFIDIDVTATEALTTEVTKQVVAMIEKCLDATTLDTTCGVMPDWQQKQFTSVGPVTWTLTSPPTVEVDESGSYFYTSDGRIDGSFDASWYGSAVAGQQVWDTYLNFPGKITIDADDKVTVTFDSDEQTE